MMLSRWPSSELARCGTEKYQEDYDPAKKHLKGDSS